MNAYVQDATAVNVLKFYATWRSEIKFFLGFLSKNPQCMNFLIFCFCHQKFHVVKRQTCLHFVTYLLKW